MTERFVAGGITCLCDIDGNSIKITGYEGNDTRIKIKEAPFPDRQELKVTCIGKKAFLGFKNLREISLPSTVNEFEDWAFAGCTHLKKLIIRNEENEARTKSLSIVRPSFGKGVFDSCQELESILLGYEETDDMSYLLGAAIWRLPAGYLFMDPDIGSDAWYNNWDRALKSYLLARDDDGYTDRVLCGEEDISYDGIGSVDGELLSDGTNYVKETRKRKCYLCFLRLMASEKLNSEDKEVYITYIKNHGKGFGLEEAWLVLKDELKGRIEYLKLYADIGAIDADKIDEMLIDLGEDYAEGKAFLIKYSQEKKPQNDFFSNLLL